MNAALAKIPFADLLRQYRAFIRSAATREMRLQSKNPVPGWLWPVLNAAAPILICVPRVARAHPDTEDR